MKSLTCKVACVFLMAAGLSMLGASSAASASGKRSGTAPFPLDASHKAKPVMGAKNSELPSHTATAGATASAPHAGASSTSSATRVIDATRDRHLVRPLDVPANDECTSAIVIPSGTYPYVTAPVDITDATPVDSEDPNFVCGVPDRTIWYSFTPTTTAAYRLSTCAGYGAFGSTVKDSVIAVIDDCSPTVSLGCNDTDFGCTTGPGFDQATVDVVMSAGVTYYIGVGHYSGTGQTPVAPGYSDVAVLVDLVPAPENDTCEGAVPLTLNRVATGTTASANDNYQSTEDAACFAGIGQTPTASPGRDVVYSFTAPAAGKYSFRTFDDVPGSARQMEQDTTLYVASDCPSSGAPTCLAGGNRMSASVSLSVQNRAEEAACLAMTAGQTVYVFVDDAAVGNDGYEFNVEVYPCLLEAEPNDTPATASPYACFSEGKIGPDGSDADFWSLGTVAEGNRIFAVVDAQATNNNDFQLRITTQTDTLEFDDNDGASHIGSNSALVSGTPGTAEPTYARVNHASTASEPYHLFVNVRPPLEQAEVMVPPTYGFEIAQPTTTGYVYGTLTPDTEPDVARFCATVGDEMLIAMSGDPTRDGSTMHPSPDLFDVNGEVIAAGGFASFTSDLTPSPGTLTGVTPDLPGEGLHYRARYTGPYWVAVFANTGAYSDYLLDVALNCQPIPQRSADPGVIQAGPAGNLQTSTEHQYVITITNPGPNIAQDVRLFDQLPPQLEFVGLTVQTNDGLLTGGPSNIGCLSLPSADDESAPIECLSYCMAPGAVHTYTLTVRVKGCIGSGVAITNTASISTLAGADNPANDTATWTNNSYDDGTCSDFNACTLGDHCEGGTCVAPGTPDCTSYYTPPGGGPPQVNPCFESFCSPEVGCVHDPSPGEQCDDGIQCHTHGLCDPTRPDANPQYGCYFPENCDHSNSCIDAFCDSTFTGQCVYTPRATGAACEDGNACTAGDVCSSSHVCTPGSGTPICDDQNVCTDDTCDPSANGCVFLPNQGACSDNNVCTIGDACGQGGCLPGSGTLNCDDADPCTFDGCDPGLGCTHTAMPAGSPCDDANTCTVSDSCDGFGACTGGAPQNCDDENTCTTDSCQQARTVYAEDFESGAPQWSHASRGATDSWHVAAQSCYGTPLPSSMYVSNGNAGLACAPNSSIERSELMSPPLSLPPAAQIMLSFDVYGFDEAGSCIASGQYDSHDVGITLDGGVTYTLLNDCYALSNVAGNAQHHSFDISAFAGQTVRLIFVYDTFDSIVRDTFAVDNVVVAEVGVPSGADRYSCAHEAVPVGTGCSDGNPCTSSDACDAVGACVGGTPQTCDDGNGCTTDGCDGNGGCSFVVTSGAACDDGNSCTSGDVCGVNGVCAGETHAPSEVDAGVSVDRSGTNAVITWNVAAGATSSDVLRGLVSALPVGPGGADETCLGNFPGSTTSDPAVPAVGTAYWYLVRGASACGAGPYGFQGSHGVPGAARISTTCP